VVWFVGVGFGFGGAVSLGMDSTKEGPGGPTIWVVAAAKHNSTYGAGF
jgi:hypothetical protein